MRLLETIRELKVNQRQGLEASSDLQSEAFTPIGEEGKKLLILLYIFISSFFISIFICVL